jgi:hypothetical protein
LRYFRDASQASAPATPAARGPGSGGGRRIISTGIPASRAAAILAAVAPPPLA